ncbi:MAG: hypothetical protein VX255_12450, partial [Candidatus Latescibacterota bacterium]|nr:hypothetical protein [Candidatus Latescibacterota bacterium]
VGDELQRISDALDDVFLLDYSHGASRSFCLIFSGQGFPIEFGESGVSEQGARPAFHTFWSALDFRWILALFKKRYALWL